MDNLGMSRRVLVVAPEDCSTSALASLLSFHDLDVVLATSSYDAMQAACCVQFEAAIVDLDCEDELGGQVNSMLSLLPGVRPRVVGLSSDPDRAQLDPAGCDKILPRRPPLALLLAALQPAAATPEQHRDEPAEVA